jgi:hypothetical protein
VGDADSFPQRVARTGFDVVGLTTLADSEDAVADSFTQRVSTGTSLTWLSTSSKEEKEAVDGVIVRGSGIVVTETMTGK